MMWLRSVAAFLMILGAACSAAGPGPSTVNPQPVPVPVPDADRIFLGGAWSGGETLVAGAPAAVVQADEVLIENVARSTTQRAAVAADGSFVMQLQWAEGEALECWSQRGADEQSPRVALLLPQIGPPPPPSVPLTVDGVSPPDAAGIVTVAGTVDRAATVVLANQDAGTAVASFVSRPGSYTALIAAAAGNRLIVFAVEPAARTRIGLVEVGVPGS